MSRKIYEDRLKRVITGIQETADNLGIHPNEVTMSHFRKQVDDVTSWDLREVGGLSAVKKNHFPIVTKDLITIRQQKEASKYINELEKKIGEYELLGFNLDKIAREAISKIKVTKVTLPKIVKKKGMSMTMEAMISDVHFGTKTKGFNLKICRERLQLFTATFLDELKRNEKEYKIDQLIVALLGDIIMSYTMHGFDSALSCEFGNAMQVQSSITSLFHDVLKPIAATGYPIKVPSVTGNHDRTDPTRTMTEPGKNNLTWIIYHSLRELCEASGMKNVKFDIPKDSYVIYDIYGYNCLYEHGDNAKALTRISFEKLMEKRANQNNTHIEFGRFGHYHDYTVFDRGRIIVNESVCGADGYSTTLGFKTSAGQVINYYVKDPKRINPFLKSFIVNLD